MSACRLDAGPSTLVLESCDGRLLLSYLGKRLPAELELGELQRFGEPLTPFGELDQRFYPLLFPTQDGISTQPPALRLRDADGRLRVSLRAGSIEQTANSLSVELEDAHSSVAVRLTVTADASGMFRWQSELSNRGVESVYIDSVASLSLPLPEACRELMRFVGFWANELQAERQCLGQSVLSVESLRGRSAHQSSPAVLVGATGFSDEQGAVLCAALEWSGNHRLSLAPSPAGSHHLLAGCALDAENIALTPGASWEAPAALLSVSAQGINELRRQSRAYWHTRKRREAADRGRLVHFNSWEAAYFDHDAQSSLRLLESAAALGAERFVLDDGWMQDRVGAGVGLGDWAPCPRRYPDGLAPIADRARALGLSFGLWVEPEMVTRDSALAREHPDWVIGMADDHPVTGRGQFVLDTTRPAVQEYMHARLVTLIEEAQPDYLKWDMNRDLAQLGGRSAVGFTRAWYAMLQRLRLAFPQLQIEACSSGGARADCGALANTDRIWPSDSMDPIQRFRLFRAVSPVLPLRWLGAHVGTARSETSGASLPLATRCAVALLGHFGMELNPELLHTQERETLCNWMSVFKAERDWLATADARYLDDSGSGMDVVVLADEDSEQALVLALQSAYPRSGQPPLLRLPGFDTHTRYRFELLNPEDCDFVQQRPHWQAGGEFEISGATLVHAGLRAPFLRYGHCALLRFKRLVSTPQS